jgi:transposase
LRKLGRGVLFSKKREAEEATSFYNRLMDIESKLEGKRVYGNAFDHFERVTTNFHSYFECSVEEHIIHLARRPKAIAQAANRFGKMILISSSKRSWDDALSIYWERDMVEKLNDELKNDLDLLPLRVHKNETLAGLIFVGFVAMVVRSLLLQRAMAAKLLDKSSL